MASSNSAAQKNALALNTFPVFDLANLLASDKKESERFRRCINVWGGFRITNIGISAAEMEVADKAGREAFKAPMEIKKKYGTFRRLAYVGHTPQMPANETLSIILPHEMNYFCDLIWPDSGSSKFREALEDYGEKMKQLSEKLHRVILGNLGVSKYYESVFKKCDLEMRMNYYHETGEDGQKTVYLTEHTDIGVFTVLKEDFCIGGLQVLNEENGDWVDLEPQPQSLIVLLGDMLKAWSNGKTRNIKHRVITQARAGAGDRLTFTLFNQFPSDIMISAPEELVDESHPRKYRGFYHDEFCTAKFGDQFELTTDVLDSFSLVSKAS